MTTYIPSQPDINPTIHNLEIEKSLQQFIISHSSLPVPLAITGAMASGKTHFLISFIKTLKPGDVIVFKPEVIYRLAPTLKSRSGAEYKGVYSLTDFFENKIFYTLEHSRLKMEKYKYIIIDEFEFVSEKEFQYIKDLKNVIYSGIFYDYLGRKFSIWNNISLDHHIHIRGRCSCGGYTEYNVRFDTNGALDIRGKIYQTPEEDPYLINTDVSHYKPLCETCFKSLCEKYGISF